MRIMRTAFSVICVAWCGCHSTGAPPATPRVSSPSRCAEVADKFATFFTQKEGAPPPAELAKVFHDVVVTRCEQDRWALTVQDCILTPSSSIDDCANGLTPQQRSLFQEEAEAKLVAAAKQLTAPDGAPPLTESSQHPALDTPMPATVESPARAQRRPTTDRAPRGGKPSGKTADPCEGGE
jgi:hypothetical protein